MYYRTKISSLRNSQINDRQQEKEEPDWRYLTFFFNLVIVCKGFPLYILYLTISYIFYDYICFHEKRNIHVKGYYFFLMKNANCQFAAVLFSHTFHLHGCLVAHTALLILIYLLIYRCTTIILCDTNIYKEDSN